jgi:hypothetical protein
MHNAVLVLTVVFAYGITAWILLMTSVYIVNRFWPDPLQKQNNNNKNQITAQPITAKQNNYKEVA